MDLIQSTATELLSLLRAKKTSSEEITSAFCDRIEAVDEKVRAFLHYDRSAAIEQARAIDRRRLKGERLGQLAGIPVAIKDLLCAKGERTTCGSKILDNYRPPYDAHVIERLRSEDAVLIGRVNMDEFAMGSSTENSAYQVTRNPWDLARVPGGSSGGSAAAVAARQTPLALGTDTGGSIRQPAGLCGVVGLKPTYGRVSRYGLVAFASSLDQIGPMAHTVADVALLLTVIAGRDVRDSTSADHPTPDYLAHLSENRKPIRIGVVEEHFGAGLDEEVAQAVRTALDTLVAQGASIHPVTLPNARHAIATYYLVATAEASSNLARYDGVHFGHRGKDFRDMIDMYSASRGEGFGAEVKRRIMLGTFALSAGYRDAYYVKALEVRRRIKEDFDRAFDNVDLIVGPVTPAPAFRVGEKSDDPLAMYLSDIYTVSANLAGIPGISLPCGRTVNGLPIGLQLQGPVFGEDALLDAGHRYQQATSWHRDIAPLTRSS